MAKGGLAGERRCGSCSAVTSVYTLMILRRRRRSDPLSPRVGFRLLLLLQPSRLVRQGWNKTQLSAKDASDLTMPVRSSGCGNCVKRKIKCDKRPGGCKRCEVHRVTCPGYRPEVGHGFIFKDMSAYTQTEAHKSYARIQHKNSVQRINCRVDTLFQTADGVSNSLSTANAQRVALHNEFLQSYLPRQASTSSLPSPLSFIEIIGFQTPISPNSALGPALDSLDLVQLGSIAKDERLLKASVGLYGKALSRLAIDLQREDLRRSDEVLASTIVLSMCELFEEIAQNNGGCTLDALGPYHRSRETLVLLYT